MPIIGLRFDSMEANRGKENAAGDIKINSTPKVTDVKEVDVASLNKKALGLSFEFLTTYAPDIGEIKIVGEVLYLSENNKKILDGWKKTKALSEEMNIEVLNHLFRSCLLKISNMADDLQLPPPISIPRVKPKEE